MKCRLLRLSAATILKAEKIWVHASLSATSAVKHHGPYTCLLFQDISTDLSKRRIFLS